MSSVKKLMMSGAIGGSKPLVGNQEAELVGSDGRVGNFGHVVALSDDGSIAVVGASANNSPAYAGGAAYVFTRSGTTWSQQQRLSASDAANFDEFAYSIDIDGDGDTIIAGAYQEDTNGTSAGSAYIFTRSGTTWSQQAKIQASDRAAYDWFGISSAISQDGNTACVGAYGETSGKGAAYVFTRSGTSWSQQAKLTASDGASGHKFGRGCDVSDDGNTIVVSAEDATSGGVSGAGAAYVYTRSGTTWSQQAKLQAGDLVSYRTYGRNVQISGDSNTVIVGAQNYNDSGQSSGACYIYTRSGSTWSQEQKLLASDGAASDTFGIGISLSEDGSVALIGARGDDDNGNASGTAYIFTRSGTTWSQITKIYPTGAAAVDLFGNATALSGDSATGLVGASQENEAYIFV